MYSKIVTILLLLGISILVALSIANLIVSKSKNDEVNRLVTYKVSQIVQSPEFLSSVNDLIKQQLPIPQKGDQGSAGKSVVGPQGPAGRDGVSVNGKDGKNGKSAYDIWLAQGNVGTEQDFLSSLVGPKGDQGSPGEVLQLQWSATGVLEQKYSQDDFFIVVPKALN